MLHGEASHAVFICQTCNRGMFCVTLPLSKLETHTHTHTHTHSLTHSPPHAGFPSPLCRAGRYVHRNHGRLLHDKLWHPPWRLDCLCLRTPVKLNRRDCRHQRAHWTTLACSVYPPTKMMSPTPARKQLPSGKPLTILDQNVSKVLVRNEL